MSRWDDKTKERFEAKFVPEPFSGCWLWTSALSRNYGAFWLNGRYQRAHRVSWQLYVGKIPGGQVLHRCDTPLCVNPSHLFLGSQSDNIRDAVQKGRVLTFPLGERHPNSKLTEQQVNEIRRSRTSQRTMARCYHVSQSQIGRVRRQQDWRHVT